MSGEGYGGGVLSSSVMKALVREVAWKDAAMMSLKRETSVTGFMVGEDELMVPFILVEEVLTTRFKVVVKGKRLQVSIGSFVLCQNAL